MLNYEFIYEPAIVTKLPDNWYINTLNYYCIDISTLKKVNIFNVIIKGFNLFFSSIINYQNSAYNIFLCFHHFLGQYINNFWSIFQYKEVNSKNLKIKINKDYIIFKGFTYRKKGKVVLLYKKQNSNSYYNLIYVKDNGELAFVNNRISTIYYIAYLFCLIKATNPKGKVINSI